MTIRFILKFITVFKSVVGSLIVLTIRARGGVVKSVEVAFEIVVRKPVMAVESAVEIVIEPSSVAGRKPEAVVVAVDVEPGEIDARPETVSRIAQVRRARLRRRRHADAISANGSGERRLATSSRDGHHSATYI